MDWFLYDNGLRHERVKDTQATHVKCVKWMELCFKMKDILNFNVS